MLVILCSQLTARGECWAISARDREQALSLPESGAYIAGAVAHFGQTPTKFDGHVIADY